MILPLSLQKRLKFKQYINMETVKVNVLYIVDAVILFIMGSLCDSWFKEILFFDSGFMYKIR